MLVLSRRVGETIVIGGAIRVAVVAVRGHQVRLGIEAPPAVAVHREEILRRSHRPPRDPDRPTGHGPGT